MSGAEQGRSVPRHVAIIMDGNGRWAASRSLPRALGHRQGVEALRRTIRDARDIGITFLTIYAFSTENWKRPQTEVLDLMGLLKRFIRNDLADMHANNVRVRIIGEREGLDPDVRGLLTEAEELTAANTDLTLVVAFNYGSQQEIALAARALAREAVAGNLDLDDITPQMIAARLMTADIPDPDLIIRTSGEQRLSNFLMWQASYAELVFVPELWPDFDRQVFMRALEEYNRRERRFGDVKASARA